MFGQCTFPNPDNSPAGAAQGTIHQSVAGLVASEFLLPERSIIYRLGRVFWATVPETAVNEECEPHLPEYKIRFYAKGRDIALRCPRRVQRRNRFQIVPALHGPVTPQRGIPTTNFDVSSPSFDSIRAQQLGQRQFRVLVSAPTNPRHHLRPLRFGENVSHFSTTGGHDSNDPFTEAIKLFRKQRQ